MQMKLISLLTVGVLGLTLAGCDTSVAQIAAAPVPRVEAAPIAKPAASKMAAMVNGQAIGMDTLHHWLVSAHGTTAINHLVGTVVVEQAAATEGITISDADVAAETTLTLQEMNPNITPAQQESLLAQLLPRKGVPRIQWDAGMRRNAYLRKMAVARVQVTEEMLTAEFNNRHGLKVQIRLIQCQSAADARKILAALAAGEEFADLAAKWSTLTESAAQGGMIPPFSRDDRMVPVAIRRAAFDLADSQASTIIRVDKYFHLIQRVGTLAPETEVKFTDVKDQLHAEITTRLTRQMQTQMLHDLMNRADLTLIDPLLKQQSQLETAGAAAKP